MSRSHTCGQKMEIGVHDSKKPRSSVQKIVEPVFVKRPEKNQICRCSTDSPASYHDAIKFKGTKHHGGIGHVPILSHRKHVMTRAAVSAVVVEDTSARCKGILPMEWKKSKKLKFKRTSAARGKFQLAPVLMGRAEKRHAMLYCDKSVVHGVGVFARHSIEEGTFIGEYTGEKVRTAVGNVRLSQAEQSGNNDTYNYDVGKGLWLDARKKGSILRFLNHSCNPNVIAYLEKPNNIHIHSIMDIKKDQELTLDYRHGRDNADPCYCGASNCKKYM